MKNLYTLEARNLLTGEKTYLGAIMMENGKVIQENFSGLEAPLALDFEKGVPVLKSPFKPGVEGIVTKFAA